MLHRLKLLHLSLVPCEFVLHLKLLHLHLVRCGLICQWCRIASGRREIAMHQCPDLVLVMHSKGLADVLYQQHHGHVLGRREFAERLP